MANSPPGWFEAFLKESGLDPRRRGNVAAVLVVLQQLRASTDVRGQLADLARRLPDDAEVRGWAAMALFVTKGEGQITGVTGPRLTGILLEHGIGARFLGIDAGRSSRGNFGVVRKLLSHIPIDLLTNVGFEGLLRELEEIVIDRYVKPSLSNEPIIVHVKPSSLPIPLVRGILEQARTRGLQGPVAQHLVGAKLQLRFPELEVPNFSVFANDVGLRRSADFQIGDEAFHVTVAPKVDELRRRVAENSDRRLQSTILVLTKDADGLRRQFDHARVRGIEEYIGDNITEMGKHQGERVREEFVRMLSVYQTRVRKVERDYSGIEIKCEDSDTAADRRGS